MSSTRPCVSTIFGKMKGVIQMDKIEAEKELVKVFEILANIFTRYDELSPESRKDILDLMKKSAEVRNKIKTE